MRNLLLTLAVLTLILCGALAFTRKPAAPPADFTFMNGTEPETVDPHKATGVPEWHIMELQKRLARAEANPGQGKPWREVLARLEAKS